MRDVNANHLLYQHGELTLDEVTILGVILLCFEHNLMGEDRTGCVTLPNDGPHVVARTSPLGADVSVDADCVCCTICRDGLYSEV